MGQDTGGAKIMLTYRIDTRYDHDTLGKMIAGYETTMVAKKMGMR